MEETAEVAHHASLLADPHTWVLFSAILFAIVAFIKGKAPVLGMLDARTTRIKIELEEAARLKKEAHDLLTEYRQKHADAVNTAQKIIDNAHEAAALIQKEAEAKMQEYVAVREKLLTERIARAENMAVQSLREQAAEIAAAAAEKLLADGAAKNGAKLVDEAIVELPKRISA